MEDKNEDLSHVRFAKTFHLWALGVGTVIGGDFFGWQAGLSAGFLGCLINLAIATFFYMLLAFSIAELSTAIPCGGGPYVFAQRAWGPGAAYFAGLAEALKVVVVVAIASSANSGYMNQVLGYESNMSPVWWVTFCVLFLLLNIGGVAMSFNVQCAATFLSLLFLIIFYVGAAFNVDYDKWVVQQDWEYQGGAAGLFSGFSFCMWFYFGIEELPLAVEETINPARDMPRGIILSFGTLTVLSFLTLFFNSAISPGAVGILNSLAPLFEGYKTIFGDNSATHGVSVLLIVGLLSSFHSFLYCMGRLLHAMAREGILPSALAKLHPTRRTPYVALLTGTFIGLAIAFILHYTIGDDVMTAVLINLSLIGALVSYAFQMSSFIRLRLIAPDMERPYRSPFGLPGAIICFLMVFAVLASIIYQGAQSSNFLISVIAAIVYFVIAAIIYVWKQTTQAKAVETTLQESPESPSNEAVYAIHGHV
ncbi:Amino Acid-Polyamine-Organocation (APC) Family [Thraustotheca clavata]|uniref:Amino Acid-Polyamine-Organocation (APC) Family n=1 Tax=Thraustotheca clavata TaxID=74557 RepID=A0A1V9ZSK8_9STRA|nr:Amino Acid-Polyamine-Organocation (APC) Family [Thraustotheca clavata]